MAQARARKAAGALASASMRGRLRTIAGSGGEIPGGTRQRPRQTHLTTASGNWLRLVPRRRLLASRGEGGSR